MIEKYFLDTNFLVYLFSEDEPQKREKCHQILANTDDQIRFVLSTQVIKEFTAVMIGKFNIPPLVVKSIIDKLSGYEIINIQLNVIKEAIDIHILNQISFWDSLIVSAASSSKCDRILSEDMNHDQIINGVKIWNPFKEDN